MSKTIHADYTDSADATAYAMVFVSKKITNVERIRSMTDEELAEWLTKVIHCTRLCEVNGERCSMFGCCSSMRLTWLREPMINPF